MAFKLAQLNQNGEITAISPESFAEGRLVVPPLFLTPYGSNYELIDESIIDYGYVSPYQDMVDIRTPSISGSALSYKDTTVAIDPRVECILTIDYPYQYIKASSLVRQDITKVTSFEGTESSTRPYHTTATKKFGMASGRFTKPSNSALTGGGLIVTNLNKNNSPIDDIVGASIDYAVEFFFNASPSAYAEDFTLVQRGTNATGAWKVSYDQSSNVVEFKFRSQLGACGSFPTNYTIISGPTGNTWYHVAVSVIRNGGSQFPATVAGYLNGATAFVNSSATGSSIPAYSGSMPIYIGNSDVGNESFNGYIDSFRYLIANAAAGGTSGVFGTAGYGFVPHGGGTLGVPTLEGFTVGNQTSFILNFNNVENSTTFYAESTDYITSVATRITSKTLGITSAPANAVELGVREVFRVQKGITGATGLSDGVGFSASYGPIVAPYSLYNAGGVTTGDKFDYAFNQYNIYDTGLTFSTFKSIYSGKLMKENAYETSLFIIGVCGACGYGSSGSPYNPLYGTNPFRRLFGTGGSQTYGASGNHNSLFINYNSGIISYIMRNGELISQGISKSSYQFLDSAGITRNLSAQNLVDLRLDLLEYRNNIANINIETLDLINTKNTKNTVKKAYLSKPVTKATLVVDDTEPLPPSKG